MAAVVDLLAAKLIRSDLHNEVPEKQSNRVTLGTYWRDLVISIIHFGEPPSHRRFLPNVAGNALRSIIVPTSARNQNNTT